MVDKKVVDTKTFSNGYKWEIAENASHRLIDAFGRIGSWASYDDPAFAFSRKAIIFTEYWDGYIEPNVLFELKKVT